MKKLKLHLQQIESLLALVNEDMERIQARMDSMSKANPHACLSPEWAIIVIVLEVEKSLYVKLGTAGTAMMVGRSPLLRLSLAEAHAVDMITRFQPDHLLSASITSQLKLT